MVLPGGGKSGNTIDLKNRTSFKSKRINPVIINNQTL